MVTMKIENADIGKLSTYFSKNVLPNTEKAFDIATTYIQKTWQLWAMGGDIEELTPIKANGKLAQSIKINKSGIFDATVYSDSEYMQELANGKPEYDMKNDSYLKGKKSRISKDNVPYVIIPFRWGTPNSKGGKRAHFGNVIPQAMYSAIQAFKMEKSMRVGTKTEQNANGQNVERSTYDWGERVTASGTINGLVRFSDDTNNKSTYFTFRIISAKQITTKPNAWVRKAVPAQNIEEAIVKKTQKEIEELFIEAFEVDLMS